MSAAQVPAVVLAGGDGQEVVARHFGLPHKAVVPILGRPAVSWVLEALQNAEHVSSCVVVTGGEATRALLPPSVPAVAASGLSILDTIRAGFAHFPASERLLFCTADLPLLSPEAVDDFLEQTLDTEAEVCYSIVSGSRLEGLPGHRMHVRLREDGFTGGNLFLLSRGFIERQADRVEAAFAGRKNKLQLAGLLGFSFILRLLTRRLSLADIVKKGEELLGVPVKVVNSAHVGVCYDIDDPAHVAMVEALLQPLE
jgi:molybdopterin-guanine dinucleotide biosynthesis protein A